MNDATNPGAAGEELDSASETSIDALRLMNLKTLTDLAADGECFCAVANVERADVVALWNGTLDGRYAQVISWRIEKAFGMQPFDFEKPRLGDFDLRAVLAAFEQWKRQRVKEVRKANLITIVALADSRLAFARATGISAHSLNRMLAPRADWMPGEVVTRGIETQLMLPPGTLDKQDGAQPYLKLLRRAFAERPVPQPNSPRRWRRSTNVATAAAASA